MVAKAPALVSAEQVLWVVVVVCFERKLAGHIRNWLATSPQPPSLASTDFEAALLCR